MTEFSPHSVTDFSWSESRPAFTFSESWIEPRLAGRNIQFITELGPAFGARAADLLRRHPEAEYRGFEPSPGLLASASGALAVYAERSSVEGRNLAIQLPLSEASQDLVLCLDLLEFLRMDQLYMTLAESRRVLRPGGLCLLRCLSPAPGFRGILASKALALFPRYAHGRHPLELNDYISPEDWRVLSETRVPAGWLRRQSVVLERL